MVVRGTTITTKVLDPKGPGIVEEIFRHFEERSDKPLRIVCGGAKHLKVFQKHDCFEPCLPDEFPRDEEGSIPKGRLFGARVYRSKHLEPNVIHVEGKEHDEERMFPVNVCQFIEKR